MTALERVHVVEALITFRAEAAGEPAVQEGEVVVELAWVTPEERDELMPWYRGVARPARRPRRRLCGGTTRVMTWPGLLGHHFGETNAVVPPQR